MTKEEALKKIEELKKFVEGEDSKKPKSEQVYMYLDVNGKKETTTWRNDAFDQKCWDYGNVFLDTEVGKAHSKIVGAFNRLMRSYRMYERGLGEYAPLYNSETTSITARQGELIASPFDLMHPRDCDQFIKDNREDLLIFFGVK